EPTLNALIELGRPAWRALAERVRHLIDVGHPLMPLAFCEELLPVRITDYVDFYASLEHVENFGRIWRPGQPAVHENWRHMPVGYHGRASTVMVSGTPVRRPRGQVAPGELAPTRALDLECEVGFVCGPRVRGPVAVDDADQHLFGVVLVNDWSARDIQRLEYVPLGPLLGKSFATSMSAWITPLDALPRVAPRRCGSTRSSATRRASSTPCARAPARATASSPRSSTTSPGSPPTATPPQCCSRRARRPPASATACSSAPCARGGARTPPTC